MKEDMAPQGLGQDQCGSRDDISLGATAALACEPAAWRYEFSTPRQEDGFRDGTVVWHVGYGEEPPRFPVRNLRPLYERVGSDA